MSDTIKDIPCDDACEQHIGKVRPVKCWIGTYSWSFNYCEAAIAEDERRGFLVVAQDESEVQP
jgi:hypothetical protein